MVITKEYRVVLPLTVDEFRIGQLWTTARLSKKETGGGAGVEVLANEPFENHPLLGKKFTHGQYTKKKYYARKKVSGLIRMLFPESALTLQEESWNAYPFTKTVATNDYMEDNFFVKVQSLHLPGNGTKENVHKLPRKELKNVEVVFIDIAADLQNPRDYNRKRDPRYFKSKKTGRGMLQKDWMQTTQPVMTCYKLVTAEFKWFGFQTYVERRIHEMQLRMFTLFYRDLFYYIDKWYGLTIEDVRAYERKTKEELDEARRNKPVRGITLES